MLSTTQLRNNWAPPCKGPWLTKDLYGRGRVTVRPAIWEAVNALNTCLIVWRYETRYADTGAYVCRPITGGSSYSLHAYGIAIDINWATNPYGPRLITDMPAAMRAAIKGIRTKNGKQVWGWGGDYSGNKDAMHYEIVCTPADLASGINWNSVPGNINQPPPVFGEPTQEAPKEEEDEDMAIHNVFIANGLGICHEVDGLWNWISKDDLVWLRQHYQDNAGLGVRLMETPISPAQLKQRLKLA